MRFVPAKRLTPAQAKRIAKHIQEWMDQSATSEPDVWQMAKEWRCTTSKDNEIVAHCEFMPTEELSRLAEELQVAFPALQEIRLGRSLVGPATIAGFDWFAVEPGEVQIGKKTHRLDAFDISFTPITVGQFAEFLNATGYQPVPDKIEKSPGYLLEHFKLNFGPSPKHPLFGVTHDDAVAFCDWVGHRLPTDPELKHFFHFACGQQKRFDYSGECWTSTSPAKDKFVAWNGPYHKEWLSKPDSNYRKLLHRHQYEFLEAPCFRVVRTVRK